MWVCAFFCIETYFILKSDTVYTACKHNFRAERVTVWQSFDIGLM